MAYSEKLQKLINQAIHCDGLTDEILSELREIADKEGEDFKEIESVLKVINESRNQPWIIKCKGNDTLEVVGTQSGLYRVLVAISRFFVLMGVYSPIFIVLTIGV